MESASLSPPAVQYVIFRTVTGLAVLVGVVCQLGLTWVAEYATKPERYACAPVLSPVSIPKVTGI